MPTITRKLARPWIAQAEVMNGEFHVGSTAAGTPNQRSLRKKLLDALRLYAEDPLVTFIVEPANHESLDPTDDTLDAAMEELLCTVSHFPASINSITVGGAKGELWLLKGVLSENRHMFTSRRFTVEILFNVENPSDSDELKVSWESIRSSN